jgi:hypothetical protein
METEEAGLEVIRAARRQSYHPATALLTAYPPPGENWHGKPGEKQDYAKHDGEDWSGENSDSLLIKPLGTRDLLRQVEALLINHAERQSRQRNSAARPQKAHKRAE